MKEELFEKYKEVPNVVKYALIEKDYTNMYGKTKAQDLMCYMYDDTETFIFAFECALYGLGKTAKRNVLLKELAWFAFLEYEKLIETGWDVKEFPYLTGNWQKDREQFTTFVTDRELNKDWVKLIL